MAGIPNPAVPSKISKTKSGKGTKRTARRKASSPRGRTSPESDDSKAAAKQFVRENESAIWKIREQIATRAYELYLRRGVQDGHALDDWIEAERQIHGDEALE